MTPELEASIRAGGRTCRGNLPDDGTPITPELRAKLKLHQVGLHPEVETAPGRAQVNALLAEGNKNAAADLDELGRAVAVVARLGDGEQPARTERGLLVCGYDLNDAIVAGPMDGEPHTVACPKCGCAITYTPPLVVDA